jgi:predicted amidohydrolase
VNPIKLKPISGWNRHKHAKDNMIELGHARPADPFQGSDQMTSRSVLNPSLGYKASIATTSEIVEAQRTTATAGSIDLFAHCEPGSRFILPQQNTENIDAQFIAS